MDTVSRTYSDLSTALTGAQPRSVGANSGMKKQQFTNCRCHPASQALLQLDGSPLPWHILRRYVYETVFTERRNYLYFRIFKPFGLRE
jgi:hypothetical protein